MNKIDFVADDLINKIIQNVYTENNKLPTERELVKHYNLPRYTIREALKKLESIGYIYKVQGSGIFVGNAVHNNTLMYNSMMQSKFKEIRSEIIYFKKITTTYELSNIFNNSSPTFWEFKRIRIIDSQKVQIEKTFLPTTLFPHLTKKDVISSIHTYVSSLGFNISHLITEYSAINLSLEDAKLLEAKRGTAVTKVRNRGYLDTNAIFELSESLNLNYSCSYVIDYNWNMHEHRKKIEK